MVAMYALSGTGSGKTGSGCMTVVVVVVVVDAEEDEDDDDDPLLPLPAVVVPPLDGGAGLGAGPVVVVLRVPDEVTDPLKVNVRCFKIGKIEVVYSTPARLYPWTPTSCDALGVVKMKLPTTMRIGPMQRRKHRPRMTALAPQMDPFRKIS